MRAAERIAEVDWLRAVAALGVFLFHLWVRVALEAGFPKQALPPFTLAGHTFAAVPSPLSLGATGVNLFFVLSGFCLTLQQLRAGRRAIRGPALRRYFQGRFARIVPAYWVAVAISALVTAWLTDLTAREIATDTGLHLFFLHGLDRTRFLSLNNALWSMATEVQFYLVFPFCFGLLSRLGGPRFVAATGLVNLAYRAAVAFYPFADGPGTGVSSSALFAYQLPGRIWEFALGMYLAELYLRDSATARRGFRWLWAPWLVMALSFRVLGPVYLSDLAFGALYASICGRILFARHAAEPGPTGRLQGAWGVWGARFGRASYSFFLLHAVVLMIFGTFFPASAAHLYRHLLFLLGASLPVSVGAAAVLYVGVELPLWRRLR